MSRTAEPVQTGVTFEEYLELEKTSPVKHEFIHGQLFLMAGSSDRHNRLAGRLYARLLSAETESCRTFFADMKVCTPDGVGYYPDVLVICDEEDDDAYVKRKPCLIVEVLSPSTEAVDRGEKLHNYLKFESLRAYVLVNQDVQRVELYERDEGGTWRYSVKERGERLELPCVGLELAVGELYVGG